MRSPTFEITDEVAEIAAKHIVVVSAVCIAGPVSAVTPPSKHAENWATCTKGRRFPPNPLPLALEATLAATAVPIMALDALPAVAAASEDMFTALNTDACARSVTTYSVPASDSVRQIVRTGSLRLGRSGISPRPRWHFSSGS